MNLKHLKEIGLSDGQIAVYKAILESGACTLKKIQEKTGIERRNIYDIITKLVEKGLVVHSLDQGMKYYYCTHPNKIREEIDAKKQSLAILEDQIPEAISLFNSPSQPIQAKVFRGEESIKSLLNEALEYESTYWLGGSSGIERGGLKIWFSQWMRQRALKKRNMYDLANYSSYLEEYPPSQREKNAESHYHLSTLPTHFRLFNTVLIFGNKIAQISWEDTPFAFVIESKEVKESYMRIFNHFWEESSVKQTAENSIKIGVIHSLTGTMAISEVSLVDALLMAVDQVNKQGGLLGKKIQPIIVDGKSDGTTFAQVAEQLITEERVCSIFGGWTSESRKTMKPIIEKYNHLLWYPVEYEGLEQSPNIIYLGATPNQQVLVAAEWAKNELGKKFFLVGSDYVFPRCVHEILKSEKNDIGIDIVGEEYRKLGERNFKDIVKAIKLARPDVIFNTINGDSNIAFFNELKKQNISSHDIPVISMSLGEDEIRHLEMSEMIGNYAVWGYFQSLNNTENQKFIKDFKKMYGFHRVISDPMEKSYLSIHLFAQAVKKARSDDVNAIRESAKGLTFDAPEGFVKIDPKTLNLVKKAHVGKIKEDGQFEIIWSSKSPLTPEIYPLTYPKKKWESFLEKLYKKWGNAWASQ
ncbi:MAG: urea transporter substrate-binding protein [archaeon]